MNGLQVFENEEFGQVRTLTIGGEPWFVGKDVAVALGHENPKKAIHDHVETEDKKMGEQNVTPYIIDSMGRKQYPTYINESGLYALIFGSKLESAKRFKRWVTSKVLPALRKTGQYKMPGVGAYEAKATSVGEVVNLLQFAKKSMEKRGCGQQEIAEASAELCSQFNIHLPNSFLASPDVRDGRAASEADEEEAFEEYVDELKVSAWERKGRSMVTCRQFNDFCAGHGISAREFRRWLSQNGYIMTSVSHGRVNYSLTIWMSGENRAERCIVFKGI